MLQLFPFRSLNPSKILSAAASCVSMRCPIHCPAREGNHGALLGWEIAKPGQGGKSRSLARVGNQSLATVVNHGAQLGWEITEPSQGGKSQSLARVRNHGAQLGWEITEPSQGEKSRSLARVGNRGAQLVWESRRLARDGPTDMIFGILHTFWSVNPPIGSDQPPHCKKFLKIHNRKLLLMTI